MMPGKPLHILIAIYSSAWARYDAWKASAHSHRNLFIGLARFDAWKASAHSHRNSFVASLWLDGWLVVGWNVTVCYVEQSGTVTLVPCG
jgi:hypothetical protein